MGLAIDKHDSAYKLDIDPCYGLGGDIKADNTSIRLLRRTGRRGTDAAPYGNERAIAYLFLPKNAKPPFQTVIFFPGSNAHNIPRNELIKETLNWLDQYLGPPN